MKKKVCHIVRKIPQYTHRVEANFAKPTCASRLSRSNLQVTHHQQQNVPPDSDSTACLEPCDPREFTRYLAFLDERQQKPRQDECRPVRYQPGCVRLIWFSGILLLVIGVAATKVPKSTHTQ